jgi:hypothetical protein
VQRHPRLLPHELRFAGRLREWLQLRRRCQASYPNGLGGTYAATGLTERDNALLACESYWGLGLCCSDGCGSCNDLGYHRCGTLNCNGSVYWNFANDLQDMGCYWTDPNEILICLDGKTWQQ